MRNLIVGLLSVFFIMPATQAQNYSVKDIPDVLKANSHAVVREYKAEINVSSVSVYTEKYTYVVTILTDNGDDESDFVFGTDKFTTLRSFSGEVYDANGKSIKKIKKSDLRFSEYSRDLAVDSRVEYYNLYHPSYPFTVKYEWEAVTKNGVLGYPFFYPVNEFNVSLQNASYHFSVPKGFDFNIKSFNMPEGPERSEKGNRIEYVWKVRDFQAVESEPNTPPLKEIFPFVSIVPHHFIYDGHAGIADNWKDYGKWQWELIEGRDELPGELRNKVKEITSGLGSDREKVKALYDYLGESTRYVSIQLGIGGWQPMTAADVYKYKFGDCKALTNYLKAMLNECGIESYYTIIGARKLYKDFPNQFQTNHVILQVPLEEETLWLECTNTRYPFGYMHSGLAGHDVAVCKEGIFEVMTIPDYPDTLNQRKRSVTVGVKSDRSAVLKCVNRYDLTRYEDFMGFKYLNGKDKTNRISQSVNIPMAIVGDLDYKENDEGSASSELTFEVEAYQYGNDAGTKMLIPLNPLRRQPSNPKRKRVYDMIYESGYRDSDEIIITLEEGMKVESLPGPIQISNRYGTFSSSVENVDGVLKVSQDLIRNSGEFPADTYSEYCDLQNAIIEACKQRIVLTRAQ